LVGPNGKTMRCPPNVELYIPPGAIQVGVSNSLEIQVIDDLASYGNVPIVSPVVRFISSLSKTGVSSGLSGAVGGGNGGGGGSYSPQGLKNKEGEGPVAFSVPISLTVPHCLVRATIANIRVLLTTLDAQGRANSQTLDPLRVTYGDQKITFYCYQFHEVRVVYNEDWPEVDKSMWMGHDRCQFAKCGTVFSTVFTSGRHHCRYCGLSFCAQHCSQRRRLPTGAGGTGSSSSSSSSSGQRCCDECIDKGRSLLIQADCYIDWLYSGANSSTTATATATATASKHSWTGGSHLELTVQPHIPTLVVEWAPFFTIRKQNYKIFVADFVNGTLGVVVRVNGTIVTTTKGEQKNLRKGVMKSSSSREDANAATALVHTGLYSLPHLQEPLDKLIASSNTSSTAGSKGASSQRPLPSLPSSIVAQVSLEDMNPSPRTKALHGPALWQFQYNPGGGADNTISRGDASGNKNPETAQAQAAAGGEERGGGSMHSGMAGLSSLGAAGRLQATHSPAPASAVGAEQDRSLVVSRDAINSSGGGGLGSSAAHSSELTVKIRDADAKLDLILARLHLRADDGSSSAGEAGNSHRRHSSLLGKLGPEGAQLVMLTDIDKKLAKVLTYLQVQD
jgi:hypothetical protein